MKVVPGRPSTDALTWWVYAEEGAAPALQLTGPGSAAAVVATHPHALPNDPALSQNVHIVTTRQLLPGHPYELVATEPSGKSASATSRTLPTKLMQDHPFTVALASCYCFATDPAVHSFYPPAQHRDEGPDPVRLRILSGDQIYMDLSPIDGGPIVFQEPNPWNRYAQQWTAASFAEFARKSPTLVMADDHEFWNDYPHWCVWLQWAESDLGGRIGLGMDRAYSVFQAALNLDANGILGSPATIDGQLRNSARTLELSVDWLKVCLLDTRTSRTRFNANPPRLAKAAWLAQALAWVRGLNEGPGILVLSQPLVEERASWWKRLTHTMGDANLPDYDADFAALWDAIFAAKHDVLVLSGDIHWSRVYSVSRSERTVYEVISSPLAKIPQGSADTGNAQGRVRWEGPDGLAQWSRRRASADTATYTTLSLIPLGSGPESGLRVRVTAWRRPTLPQQGAQPLYTDEFELH